MYQKGIIFDISHYMLEDGPGIRTNVFFKGCPLRCKWCSNAFGLERKMQMAYTRSKCTGCRACAVVCKNRAISFDENGYAVQDFRKCTHCMACTLKCHSKARVQIGREVTSLDVFKEVEKDRIFYRRGQGGITLSGGEILMQPAFAAEILNLCVHEGINTAIETSAFGKWDDLSAIINLCDTVFIDCKCIDREKHMSITGVDNSIILENIKRAAALCNEKGNILIIRLPLIPTINDTEDNIMSTAAFVSGLEGTPLLNILPYHNFGVSKYETIGKKCETEALEPFTKGELERIKSLLDQSGIRYSIGGYDIDC